MQVRVLLVLSLVIIFTEGFWFNSKPKCPIKKYKTSKYITGDQLLLHEDFHNRVKPLENLAKDCKVRVNIKGSYYQLSNPAEQILVSDADLIIGHAFQFALHDENNVLLCNKICLAKNPTDIPQVKCFLQAVINHGLTWSKSNTDVISDGTYAANTVGYQSLKTDIQTRCQNEKLKRQLLRAMREMYEEEEEEEEEEKTK